MQSTKIEIYGWDPASFKCNPCLKAKRLMESVKLNYEFKPIPKNMESEIKEELIHRLKQDNIELKTLPQIFVNGELVGGFTETKLFMRKLRKSEWQQ